MRSQVGNNSVADVMLWVIPFLALPAVLQGVPAFHDGATLVLFKYDVAEVGKVFASAPDHATAIIGAATRDDASCVSARARVHAAGHLR